MCPATGSSCGPRLAGGDGLARELTREEKRAIRALVTRWCANYDRECGCLPLDCECYMLGKCWTGAYCRPQAGFQDLPGLWRGRPCGWAHGLLLRVLCPDCPAAAKAGLYAEKAEVMCGKLGPGKPAWFKAFRGPFGGGAYLSMACPCFAQMLSTSTPAASGHFVQRWRGI